MLKQGLLGTILMVNSLWAKESLVIQDASGVSTTQTIAEISKVVIGVDSTIFYMKSSQLLVMPSEGLKWRFVDIASTPINKTEHTNLNLIFKAGILEIQGDKPVHYKLFSLKGELLSQSGVEQTDWQIPLTTSENLILRVENQFTANTYLIQGVKK